MICNDATMNKKNFVIPYMYLVLMVKRNNAILSDADCFVTWPIVSLCLIW